MKQILVVLSILCATPSAYSQKLLQLEKSGSLKTVRFYTGDVMTFMLRNDDKGWHTRTIEDFDLANNRIVFHNYVLPLDSIEMIQLNRNQVMQIVGGALQGGGVNMMLFSTYYSVFRDRSMEWGTFISGAANVGIGTLLRKLFRKKRFKPGKRKRLRLLDLNFGPPVPKKSSS